MAATKEPEAGRDDPPQTQYPLTPLNQGPFAVSLPQQQIIPQHHHRNPLDQQADNLPQPQSSASPGTDPWGSRPVYPQQPMPAGPQLAQGVATEQPAVIFYQPLPNVQGPGQAGGTYYVPRQVVDNRTGVPQAPQAPGAGCLQTCCGVLCGLCLFDAFCDECF